MRLIDADKLLNKIDAYMCGSQDVMFVKELIKEQPTAFDVEKVVSELEDYKMWKELLIYNLNFRERQIIKKAIDIVKRGGINDN